MVNGHSLSIIIVNYNVKHYLWQCLDSVRRASEGLDVEVWVVDNASKDGSLEYVRRDFPNIHVIENTENVGFACANNMAIRLSRGDLVLLLNPDTIVSENALRGCLAFFASHPKAGVLGIRMLNRDGSFARESRRGLPTPATAFFKVCGLCKLYPTHPRFGRYYMGHLPEDKEGQIEVISGAFMMLRRDAVEQVGLLDEDYFMYGEDIDLSYCIGQAGWECWYSPQLMMHYKGESTHDTSFRYIHSFYNAMLIFFRKHFARRYWFSWLVIEIAVVVMGIAAFIRNHLRDGINTLKNRLFPSQSIPERLYFIGTDNGWSELQALLNSHPEFTGERISNIDEADKNAEYITFEVTPDGQPYHDMLTLLSQVHDRGMKAHLGTFNRKTQTLILPNDIVTSAGA